MKIKVSVVVTPSELNGEVYEYITNIVRTKLENRIIENVGIISEIVDIESIEGGKIMASNGSSVFKVNLNVKVESMSEGENIIGKISQITIHGFYINKGKFEIFSLSNLKTLQIGDTVKVKITKSKYDHNTKKIVVLGQLVERQKLAEWS